ncbi:MAG: Ig-like domain-containing domain, partial [Dysgonamonadaceae bacterium]|nr:Ig-like domain-containing domain [Dysgonamonadaceae bacterium]MDD3726881.1 Ig-like domain-containing domain [Dysgonamonadaceae bacterium]MDD4605951.1 Ig-like domain-containing domain [Dysgonamonadaceae bacterium]
MFSVYKNLIYKTLYFIGSVLLLYACANIAAPTGGLYDVDPPKVVKASPDFNETNSKQSKIEILFDENVKIENPMEKVIIAPPQQSFPVIKAQGRKVIIELEDELEDNTTYTIDFTDAIVDNNEGNPLENFSLSFSTGDKIDSLAISGIVLRAENLEPVQGIYVGIHSNLNDTAFTKTPFKRISRTDSRGIFTIKGVAEGKYRVYALGDLNRNYKYDNPQEEIAFLDSIVVPSSIQAMRNDTVFKDSLTIDTIYQIQYTRFLPDNILLRSFESGFERQYLQKHERTLPYKLDLFFAAPTKESTFSLLEPTATSDNWYVKESNVTNDSVSIWITDSLIFQMDTVKLIVDYLRTDTLNNHVLNTDTLNFTFRGTRKKESDKEKKKDEKSEEPIRHLNIRHTIQSTHEIFNPIYLEFEQPLTDFDSTKIKLQHEVDSLIIPIEYALSTDSLNSRKYRLQYKWEPGEKYKLLIDSAAFESVYGLHNDKLEQTFNIKKLEQYGNLLFVITGLPQGKTAYVELLDAQDKPFRKKRVRDNEALFMDLNPGKLYARLFIDENEDGEWTSGDYELKRQPEIVFYNPKAYEIRAFTNHEEPWDLNEQPFNKQKPLEITKNKPEEKKRRNRNEEERQRGSQSQRSSTPPMN